MNKKSLLVILASAGLMLSACGGAKEGKGYTYNSYSSALGDNWNPHTWETNADDSVLGYLSSTFTDLSIKNSTTGEYQWVYEMATAVKDVTASHQSDLTKYGSVLPDGVTDVKNVKEQYVYEISLRDGMKWQNGDKIDAESFIYSMKMCLEPKMKNYRANNYYSGETAIAGAEEYYYQGSTVNMDNGSSGAITALTDCVKGQDGVYTFNGGKCYIGVAAGADILDGDSPKDFVDYYGAQYFDVDGFKTLTDKMDDNGFVPLTDENLQAFNDSVHPESVLEVPSIAFIFYEKNFPECSWDKVGFYAEGNKLYWVLKTAAENPNFLTTCASEGFLVHKATYEKYLDKSGSLWTTSYGTSVETSMSYGPYILASFQEGKQMVFEQNPNWYGYSGKNSNGYYVSYTNFEIDGKKVQQYQTTKIVVDVMEAATAKLAFEKGQLDEYAPTADELSDYTLSKALYQVDETYTERFFFNTKLEALQEMDKSKGNTNSVVLSNKTFRKAFSLAINRAEWVTTTEAWKPACFLINSLYYYDVWNNPASIYRNSNEAKESICKMYNVEYGAGKAYADLDTAYASITGYNLDEAKNLFKQAYNELTQAGLLKGTEIKIKVAYKKGTMESPDNAQVAKLNEFLKAAIVGSGFTKFELEGLGNITNRYADVPAGEYAIGFGAWGGAAFYPFTMFRCYCDPTYTSLHEGACFDPTKETVTFKVDGKDVTKTWQEWSCSMSGTGVYANAAIETKLSICTQLETAFLGEYYCIPLATTTASSLLGYQLKYFTQNYNIMYGFGGLRLMSYNYNDEEWDKFVSSQGGTLNYK